MSIFDRVIWAVEAFPETPDLTAQAARALRAVLPKAEEENLVEPVYVRRPKQFNLESQDFRVEGKNLEADAKRNVEKVLSITPVPHVRPLKYLTADGNSLRMTVSALIDYALESSATVIAVSTHARKRVPRLFLGSFAESLILESPLPVMISNPVARLIPDRITHILFPTDFSEKSRDAFEQIVGLARELNAKLLLFHKFEYPYHETAYPFVPPVLVRSIQELIEEKKHEAEEWVKRGESEKIEVRFHLSKCKSDAATAIIRNAAKLPSGMIAIASQTGPIASAILGSVTRKVIRGALCPVLVVHPAEKRVEKEERRKSPVDPMRIRTSAVLS